RQSDGKADKPGDLSQNQGGDVHEDFEQHSKLRAPSALSHASSAASASSTIDSAALGCPVRWASAAAMCSCQMAAIPPRASMDKASCSVRVLPGVIFSEPSASRFDDRSDTG